MERLEHDRPDGATETMSTWLPALPALLVVAVLVLIPGAAMTYAAGARGVVAWGVAPGLSMTALSVGACLAPVLHLAWAPGLYVASAAVGVALTAGAGLGARRSRGWPGWPGGPRRPGRDRRRRPRRPATPRSPGHGATHDPVRSRWFAAAGCVVGTGLVLAAVLPAVGTPGELVDSTDAVAHLNRIRQFLDTGVFSSLGTVSGPAYPSAFHDIAGTLAQVVPSLAEGPAIVATANLTAIGAAAIVWPLGFVALTRVTLGRSGVTLVAAGVLSAALTTFPYILMGWGVLWPNLLGATMLPGVLGPTLVACGVVGPVPGLPRPLAAVLTAAALPGLTFAHPNALVSLLLIVVLAVATRLTLLARTDNGARGRRARLRLGALVALVVGGLLLAPRLSRQVADTASYDWGAHEALTVSLRDSALLALQEGAPPWGLLLLVAVGALVCARRDRLRWVLVTWVALVLLFVMAATGRPGWGSIVTGYWYNDKVRLAALLALPCLLLAVVGVVAVARALGRLLTSFTPANSGRRRAPWGLTLSAGAGAMALALLLTTGANHDRVGELVNRYYFPRETTHVLLTPGEDADLAALAALIPPDVVTADVPANGSALLYAFHDRPVLFTSLLLDPDPDHALIGLHLKEAATRDDVCDALRRDNVQYAVTGPVRYWLSLSDRTTGMAALGGTPGFAQVGASGRYRLYRIQACGFDPAWLPAA